MSGIEKTLEIMEGMMNSICSFLKLTMESCLDFEGVLPTLDLIIWVRVEDNKTMYSFYSKPMASSKVLQRDCAMPENKKIGPSGAVQTVLRKRRWPVFLVNFSTLLLVLVVLVTTVAKMA